MMPPSPYDKVRVAKKANNHRAKTLGDIKAAATKAVLPVKVRAPARNPRAFRVRPGR